MRGRWVGRGFGLLWGLCWAAAAAAGPTERADVNAAGREADASAFAVAISGNGQYVAFESAAGNLTPDDDNAFEDVFVFDRRTRALERVSVPYSGGEVDGDSVAPAISADGRYVAFVSNATNLVLGGTDGRWNVFVRDRQSKRTRVVTVSLTGADADGDSDFPSISDDGRFVAYTSTAENLVASDGNGFQDIFVTEVGSRTTMLVSVDSRRNQADGHSFFPVISRDGSFVAYSSDARNLVPNDTNSVRDVFVYDRARRTVVRASVSTAGAQGNGPSDFASLNGDGSVVAFASLADNLVLSDLEGFQDIFVRDLETGFTTRQSVATGGATGDGDSTTPVLSADGRFVAFASLAENLVPRDTGGFLDIFVRDRVRQQTVRVSVARDGTPGNGDSYLPALTAEGREVAFLSEADNLVPGDVNHGAGVYVHRWITFSDVPPEFPAFREIEAVAAAGVAQGFADGSFAPGWEVTRAQMAVFLARALAGGDGQVPPGPTRASFTDVPRSYWAFRHIEFLTGLGVVRGYADGSFAPEWEVSRAQMAVFLARALAGGEANVPPGPPTATFPDVPTDFWAFHHIEFLVDLGVVHGFEDGRYHPELPVSRAQMAIFLAQAFALPFPGD